MTRVTQKDVAQHLGVSVTLVSRCLSGSAADIGVSEATIERVTEAAARMGYVPNSAARSLRGSSTRTLGVVVWDFMDPFLGSIVSTLQDLAHNEGYSLLLCGFLRREFSEHDLLPIQKTPVDGLIIVGSDDRLDWTKSFLAQQLPVVRIGTGSVPKGMLTIGSDEAQGFAEIVALLTRKGHRQVVFAGADYATHDRRLNLFLEVAATANLSVFPVRCQKEFGTSAEAGRVAIQSVLQELSTRKFTAVVGANDLIALGAWAALHEAGLHVPRDISLVGFDDIPASSLCVPGLTTVKQNIRLLSSTAFKAVVDPSSFTDKLVSSSLVERGTVEFAG